MSANDNLVARLRRIRFHNPTELAEEAAVAIERLTRERDGLQNSYEACQWRRIYWQGRAQTAEAALAKAQQAAEAEKES